MIAAGGESVVAQFAGVFIGQIPKLPNLEFHPQQTEINGVSVKAWTVGEGTQTHSLAGQFLSLLILLLQSNVGNIYQQIARFNLININKKQMGSKVLNILLLAVLVLAVAQAMPTESKLPAGLNSADILFADSSIGKEMLVVVTKSELSIYKLSISGLYSLLHNQPVCQATALSVAETGFLPSNENGSPVYSVVVGCSSGYFHIYEISLDAEAIVKSFAKNLNQPIVKLLPALPYLLVSTTDNIYMFNMKDSQVQLEIPIAGQLSQLVFQDDKKIISGSDRISEIQIIVKETGLEIKRKPVTRQVLQPILIHSRLLQNQNKTAICGDGTIDSGEQCDDGNTVSGDGCTAGCVLEFCGDGTANNKVEQCDDGNSVALDGCTNCTYDCGNNVIDTTAGEECDDGNRVDNDGCSASCLNEKKASYQAAIGVGLGVSAVGLVGVVGGTAATSASTGVSASLVGVNPIPAPVVSHVPHMPPVHPTNVPNGVAHGFHLKK